MRGSMVALACCVVAMYAGASGCASYKAARPVAVCGTTVDPGGPGIAILDVWAPPLSASGSPPPTGTAIDGDNFELARVSDNCTTGAGPPLAVTLTITKGRSVRTLHMLAYYPGPGEVVSSPAPTG